MHGHDIIVIGTSAGGLKALTTITAGLPADLKAAVFVVQHLAADKPSILPEILSDVGSLPAAHPTDGEKIRNGRIYVAPPDHHLLVNHGLVRLVRGPQENRFRPSIDALFRSAARAYGPRVTGVVLTGYLDDGTVGLQAVKKRGGVTIVQDPDEAEYSSMPKSALRHVPIDHCLPLADIPDLLVRMTRQPAADDDAYPVPLDVEIESNIAEQTMNTKEFLENVEKIGSRTSYTCPECNGSIWQIGDEDPLRFRCHVGHSYTSDTFLGEQTQNLENALWSAVREMEEKVTFTRQMAARKRKQSLDEVASRYEEHAKNLDNEVTMIRDLIVCGFATRRGIAGVEQ